MTPEKQKEFDKLIGNTQEVTANLKETSFITRTYLNCSKSELEDWIEAYKNEEGEKMRENISIELMRLDWIKILNEAIKMRKSSWNEDPVREWRNASDEICGAVLRAMKMTLSDNLNSNKGTK